MQQGAHNGMTRERVKALQDIGVVFSSRKGGTKKTAPKTRGKALPRKESKKVLDFDSEASSDIESVMSFERQPSRQKSSKRKANVQPSPTNDGEPTTGRRSPRKNPPKSVEHATEVIPDVAPSKEIEANGNTSIAVVEEMISCHETSNEKAFMNHSTTATATSKKRTISFAKELSKKHALVSAKQKASPRCSSTEEERLTASKRTAGSSKKHKAHHSRAVASSKRRKPPQMTTDTHINIASAEDLLDFDVLDF